MADKNSILTSVKENLGITEDQTDFDNQIIVFINSVLSTLAQLGVGPEGGFFITSDSETWDQLIGDDNNLLNMTQTYVYMRVRLMFDPPQSSLVKDVLEANMREQEWRLNCAVDPNNTFISDDADKA